MSGLCPTIRPAAPTTNVSPTAKITPLCLKYQRISTGSCLGPKLFAGSQVKSRYRTIGSQHEDSATRNQRCRKHLRGQRLTPHLFSPDPAGQRAFACETTAAYLPSVPTPQITALRHWYATNRHLYVHQRSHAAIRSCNSDKMLLNAHIQRFGTAPHLRGPNLPNSQQRTFSPIQAASLCSRPTRNSRSTRQRTTQAKRKRAPG